MYDTVHNGDRPAVPRPPADAFDLVVMVASQGGLAAYRHILAALPPEFPAAVVVLQHRLPKRDSVLSRLLAQCTALQVEDAEAGEPLRAGTMIVAPADRQLLVAADQSLVLTPLEGRLALADPLLASAAAAFGPRLLAVVLSGRLGDGAAGVLAVKRAGGRVLAQDRATAECFGMPNASIATGCVDFVLPLDIIAPALAALVMAPGVATWLRVPVPAWTPLASPPAEGQRVS